MRSSVAQKPGRPAWFRISWKSLVIYMQIFLLPYLVHSLRLCPIDHTHVRLTTLAQLLRRLIDVLVVVVEGIYPSANPSTPTIIQLLRQVQLLHVVQLDLLCITDDSERYAEGVNDLKHLGVGEDHSQVVKDLLGNVGSVVGSLNHVDVGRRLLEQTHHAVVAVDGSTVGLYSQTLGTTLPLRALMSMVPLLVSRRWI